MAENKKNIDNPVAKLRDQFHEIKRQNKIRSQKIKEAFIREKSEAEKKNERKIAKPRTPEADV